MVTALATTAALLAVAVLPGHRGYPLLGLAVGAGSVVHTLGDMVTRQGCPVLWPVPLGCRRWYEFGVPDPITVRAGGWVEKAVLPPVLVLVGVVGAVLAVPSTAEFVAAVLATG